jgi:hypothetical protein
VWWLLFEKQENYVEVTFFFIVSKQHYAGCRKSIIMFLFDKDNEFTEPSFVIFGIDMDHENTNTFCMAHFICFLTITNMAVV